MLRFVALGDSFTEGVGDHEPRRPNGVRGWADRVAEQLAVGEPGGVRYANLAVRGKLFAQIVDEQVERALALDPDVVTLYAGANDIVKSREAPDFDALFARYEETVLRLRETGARVLVWTAFDTVGAPVYRLFRGRFAVYSEYVRRMAARTGAELVDYWWMDGYRDPRMWDWDRMHMSTAGHVRMACEVLDVLGVEHELRPPDLGPMPEVSRAELRRETREWALGFAVPWIGRRLRGVSTGDTLKPRFPTYVDPSALL